MVVAPENTDDWRPTASIETLKLRARILARIRDYFAQEGVFEVDTPILSRAGTTDPHLHSFAARSLAPGDSLNTYYLHTSPEFAMKRLLAAGSGSIYQIGKVFRAGETGRRHNPEFTMLEWYRVGFDYHQLMNDAEALVVRTLADLLPLRSSERLSYADAFKRYAGVDPHAANAADLRACAQEHNVAVQGLNDEDVDGWLNLLITHVVEPNLGRGPRLTFLYDYPASQAALARVRDGTPAVAERFEIYVDGIELANGFHELGDSEEQRLRFENDRRLRSEHHLADVPTDQKLLEALRGGLPECSGVALGIDRLLMLVAGAQDISDVIAFPTPRA